MKIKALADCNDNYDAYMKLNLNAKDLLWWKNHILTGYRSIREIEYTIEIFSDASLTDWGAVCGSQRFHGFWTKEEQVLNINLLELKAAFFGLNCFAKNLRSCNILLRIDNTTAICYINRMGGTQYIHLNNIAREIWEWCENRRLWIFASYISSKENIEADVESRRLEPETEYEISVFAFEKIMKAFGEPVIDLFASRSNTKCKSYVSWKKDPGSIAIDAFTLSWKKSLFYAFPPFAIILKVLNKIKSEKAEGIVVVPDWPTQPWYPIYQSMLDEKPIYFEPNEELLTSFNREPHPLWRHLTLVAGRLSGRH